MPIKDVSPLYNTILVMCSMQPMDYHLTLEYYKRLYEYYTTGHEYYKRQV